jgi:hypothetical protein
MKNKIYVWGPKDRPNVPTNAFKINTTSTSTDFGQAFSPFMNQGTIEFHGLKSHNVENMWQGTKTYGQYVNNYSDWKLWRDGILGDTKAHRYPMGKGARPEFSYIKSLGKLGYIDARMQIYIPIYRQKLDKFCQRQIQSVVDILTLTDVWLFDFDGYLTDRSLDEVFADPASKAGHAFVIKQYIEDNYDKL